METLDAIKALVTKLLATATSDNEHEAALAMSKATELIEKHKLSMAELTDAETSQVETEAVIKDESPIFAAGRISSWKTNLVSAIAKINGCKLIKYTGQGYAVGGQRGSKLVIFGRPSDIGNTRFLLAFAITQLTRLAPKGQGKEYANSWYLGAVEGIRLQMNDAKKKVQAGASSYALIKLDNRVKEVDSYIADTIGKLRKGASSHSNINWDAYSKGQTTGRNMDLNGRSRVSGGGNTLGMR